jgi:2-polyprenyl-6-methoxyphenol hydroxylase-like FAD-dependent oxidoreductase
MGPIMDDGFEVIVVGGGPVGLWLACELALAKVKVVVLERRAERVTQSRALTLHGRTLEMFALRGLADRFLSLGRPVPGFHFGGLDTPLDLSVFESRFPFTLFLPQATTERLIEEHALELGVDIRRGCLVELVEQHATGVVIEGRSREASFRMSAGHVVGADGARSIVRRAAGIDFAGYPARHTMTLGDVVLDAPPERPVLTMLNEAGGMVLAPRGDGIHHRLGVIDALSPHVALSEPVSLTELAACAARVFGRDLRLRDPVWLSRFTDETRLAEHFRKGRIFLAGDAAHINVPMGGQGMNVGLQDAMNLGWKLASVIRGTAPEALLDTYERERWPVGKALQQNTLAQFSLFSRFDPPALAMRSMLNELLGVLEVNRQLSDRISGFGVSYPEPLSPPPEGWEHRKGVSGQRFPDMNVLLKDGSHTTVHNLLRDGREVQLQLTSDESTAPDANIVAGANLVPGQNKALLADLASVLVRPDGYLSHVVPVDKAFRVDRPAEPHSSTRNGWPSPSTLSGARPMSKRRTTSRSYGAGQDIDALMPSPVCEVTVISSFFGL